MTVYLINEFVTGLLKEFVYSVSVVSLRPLNKLAPNSPILQVSIEGDHLLSELLVGF